MVHRTLGYHQLRGDLTVGEPSAHEGRDLRFTASEDVQLRTNQRSLRYWDRRRRLGFLFREGVLHGPLVRHRSSLRASSPPPFFSQGGARAPQVGLEHPKLVARRGAPHVRGKGLPSPPKPPRSLDFPPPPCPPRH